MEKIIIFLLSAGLLIFLYLYISTKRAVAKLYEDILEKKRTDSNLLLQNTVKNKALNDLTKEINDLFKDMRKIKVDSEKERQTLDLAIHNIMHDIRTPLTVASGFTQQLLRNDKENLMLNKIQSNLQIVSNRLEILLEYQRLLEKSTSPTNETVNFSTKIKEELLKNYERFSCHFEVEHAIEEDIMIYGDVEFAERILQNIFGNVAKHGAQYVTISLDKNVDYAILNVSNKVQQPIENLEKLTSRFYSENMSETEKSSGLGLYITNEWVELMGGFMKLDFQEELFYLVVHLPLVK